VQHGAGVLCLVFFCKTIWLRTVSRECMFFERVFAIGVDDERSLLSPSYVFRLYSRTFHSICLFMSGSRHSPIRCRHLTSRLFFRFSPSVSHDPPASRGRVLRGIVCIYDTSFHRKKPGVKNSRRSG